MSGGRRAPSAQTSARLSIGRGRRSGARAVAPGASACACAVVRACATVAPPPARARARARVPRPFRAPIYNGIRSVRGTLRKAESLAIERGVRAARRERARRASARARPRGGSIRNESESRARLDAETAGRPLRPRDAAAAPGGVGWGVGDPGMEWQIARQRRPRPRPGSAGRARPGARRARAAPRGQLRRRRATPGGPWTRRWLPRRRRSGRRGSASRGVSCASRWSTARASRSSTTRSTSASYPDTQRSSRTPSVCRRLVRCRLCQGTARVRWRVSHTACASTVRVHARARMHKYMPRLHVPLALPRPPVLS